MIRSHSDHRLLPSLSTSPSRRRIEASGEINSNASLNLYTSATQGGLARALGFVPESVLDYSGGSSQPSPAQVSTDNDLAVRFNSLLLSNDSGPGPDLRPATAPNFPPFVNSHRAINRVNTRSRDAGQLEGGSTSEQLNFSGGGRGGSRMERNVQRLRNESRELIHQLINENTVPTSTNNMVGLLRRTPSPSVPTLFDLHYLQTYDMRNNFYLNLVTWCRGTSKIAVAVKEKAYWWDGLRNVAAIDLHGNIKPISVISCAPSNVLAIGFQDGGHSCLCLYLTPNRRLSLPHDCAFQCIAWFPRKPWFVAGDMHGRIFIMEYNEFCIRVKTEWKGFDQQVCGISLNADSTQVAVGANENVALVWSIEDPYIPLLLCRLEHHLAVKGIAFCPWTPNLLATGGGSNDRHLRFWHTATGTLLREYNTKRQVTSITWSTSHREVVVTFGFDEQSPSTLVAVYSYPSLKIKANAFTKDRRALSAEVSPDQSKIAVATSDGTVRLYQLWEPRNATLLTRVSVGVSLSYLSSSSSSNLQTKSYYKVSRTPQVQSPKRTSMDQNPQKSATKATILLMGLRRGGKSSICKVVFHNMQPLDTLYLESTSKPTSEQFLSLIDLSVMELPGQLNYFEPTYDSERLFSSVGALVYVIDSQDEYLNALTNLSMIIEYAYKVNPLIHIEVLIHKIDGLSEDYRMDAQGDIMQRTGDELLDLGLEGVQVSFYLTSIFDHSIYEAFSRIVQKLITELPSLENMLDNLVAHSSIDKVFLFDVNSKIYVATDSSPVDIQTYEVCAEFIDITIDLDDLYLDSDNKNGGNSQVVNRNDIRSISHLSNGSVLYLKQMIRGLALVALIRNDDDETSTNKNSNMDELLTVIDYNVGCFKKSLMKMWKSAKFQPTFDANQ